MNALESLSQGMNLRIIEFTALRGLFVNQVEVFLFLDPASAFSCLIETL